MMGVSVAPQANRPQTKTSTSPSIEKSSFSTAGPQKQIRIQPRKGRKLKKNQGQFVTEDERNNRNYRLPSYSSCLKARINPKNFYQLKNYFEIMMKDEQLAQLNKSEILHHSQKKLYNDEYGLPAPQDEMQKRCQVNLDRMAGVANESSEGSVFGSTQSPLQMFMNYNVSDIFCNEAKEAKLASLLANTEFDRRVELLNKLHPGESSSHGELPLPPPESLPREEFNNAFIVRHLNNGSKSGLRGLQEGMPYQSVKVKTVELDVSQDSLNQSGYSALGEWKDENPVHEFEKNFSKEQLRQMEGGTYHDVQELKPSLFNFPELKVEQSRSQVYKPKKLVRKSLVVVGNNNNSKRREMMNYSPYEGLGIRGTNQGEGAEIRSKNHSAMDQYRERPSPNYLQSNFFQAVKNDIEQQRRQNERLNGSYIEQNHEIFGMRDDYFQNKSLLDKNYRLRSIYNRKELLKRPTTVLTHNSTLSSAAKRSPAHQESPQLSLIQFKAMEKAKQALKQPHPRPHYPTKHFLRNFDFRSKQMHQSNQRIKLPLEQKIGIVLPIQKIELINTGVTLQDVKEKSMQSTQAQDVQTLAINSFS